MLTDPDIYWIDEAIYADEVTITLETAAGDTLGADVLRGLLGVPANWSVTEAGVMRSDERVYVAFRNATPAETLLERETSAPRRDTGRFEFIPLDLSRRGN